MAQGPPIAAVRVGQGWTAASISRAEHAAVVAAGLVPPVAALLGLRLAVRPDIDDGTGVDNPFMAWLMVEPVSGLAPARWQSGVGPCTVVRADGHDYTPDDHGILHDFMHASSLVGLLGRPVPAAESAAGPDKVARLGGPADASSARRTKRWNARGDMCSSIAAGPPSLATLSGPAAD